MLTKYEERCEAFWITQGNSKINQKNNQILDPNHWLMPLKGDFDWFDLFTLHTKAKSLFVASMEDQSWHYLTRYSIYTKCMITVV